jgi:hypothetical protein
MTAAPALLDEHKAIVGQSGTGKTVTAKSDVEQLLRQRRHLAVIDITGVWWGLRSDVAGTGPGFDIPIFGGRKADVPIGPADGDAIARLIVEQSVSAIVDLSHLHDDALQRQFLAPFVKRLRAKPRGNFHLIADEAEEYCPQTAPDDLAFELTRDMVWIAKRGRVAGFVLTLITQRPADVAKAVLSQAQTIVAHQLIDPRDQKAIDDYLKAKGDKETRQAVMASLPSLSVGERWIYSPRLHLLERGVTAPIATFDSSRTPAPGEVQVEPRLLSEIDVSAIAAALKKPEETPADPTAAFDAGAAAGEALRAKDATIVALRSEVVSLKRRLDAAEQLLERRTRSLTAIGEILIGALPAADRQPSKSAGDGGEDVPPSPPPSPPAAGEAQGAAEAAPPAPGKRSGSASPDWKPRSAEDAAGDPEREYRALAVLAAAAPAGLTEAAWAARSGYSRKGGAWNRRRSRYQAAGLIEKAGNRFYATDAGRARVGEDLPDFPPPGPALVAFWAGRLGTAAGRILRRLAELYPQALSRGAIADEVRMSGKGGAFVRAVGELKAAELLEERGRRLRVAPAIMLEDAR